MQPIPVKFDPDPTNDVAVTTPETFSPPSRLPYPAAENVPPTPEAPNSTPDRAVTIPTESTLVTSSYVNTPPTDDCTREGSSNTSEIINGNIWTSD